MFIAGQQIGPYKLLGKLGRGGFGEVWLAERHSQFLTKKVAVKLPHDDQVNLDAIRREAELWEQASGHPNVLPIIDADIYDGQVVIVSEFADGGSLSDLMKREGRIPVKKATEITADILRGLEFLHLRQIIHRDIKPQNILIQGNTPRLADFGISRVMTGASLSSMIVGTDSYMAPEAFDGQRNVQTDVWSVGVVFYQMMKGSLPFPQDHPSERMFAVLTKEFEPLPLEVPQNFRYIVEKALAKQPAARYRSAREMLDDVRAVLSNIALPSMNQWPVEPAKESEEQQTIQRSFEPNEFPPTMPIDRVPRAQYAQPQGYQPQFQQRPPYGAQPHFYPPQRIYPAGDPTDNSGIRVLAGFSYLGHFLCVVGIILGIITIVQDANDKFARFHGIQSLLLIGVYFVSMIVSSILGAFAGAASLDGLVTFMTLVQVFLFLSFVGFAIVGGVQSFRGEKTLLPFVGSFAERWA